MGPGPSTLLQVAAGTKQGGEDEMANREEGREGKRERGREGGGEEGGRERGRERKGKRVGGKEGRGEEGARRASIQYGFRDVRLSRSSMVR